jgi:hypothetical protein
VEVLLNGGGGRIGEEDKRGWRLARLRARIYELLDGEENGLLFVE